MPSINAQPYTESELALLVTLAERRGIGYVEKRLIATIRERDKHLEHAHERLDGTCTWDDEN